MSYPVLYRIKAKALLEQVISELKAKSAQDAKKIEQLTIGNMLEIKKKGFLSNHFGFRARVNKRGARADQRALRRAAAIACGN